MIPNNLGAIWAGLTQKAREDVLKETAEWASERFDLYRDELREAGGLKRPRPDVRLQMYAQRTPELWAAIRMFQPQMWLDDLKDLEQLRAKAHAEEAPRQAPREGTVQPPAAY